VATKGGAVVLHAVLQVCFGWSCSSLQTELLMRTTVEAAGPLKCDRQLHDSGRGSI
jgi:hypothetical protein